MSYRADAVGGVRDGEQRRRAHSEPTSPTAAIAGPQMQTATIVTMPSLRTRSSQRAAAQSHRDERDELDPAEQAGEQRRLGLHVHTW